MGVQVISGSLAGAPQAWQPALPKREALPPEDLQLSGPYGPVFVGYGPAARVPLLPRLVLLAIGVAGTAGPLAWFASSGRLSF